MGLGVLIKCTHTIIGGGMYFNDWNRPGRAYMSLQVSRTRPLALSFGEVRRLSGGLWAIGMLCEMNGMEAGQESTNCRVACPNIEDEAFLVLNSASIVGGCGGY